MPKLNNIKNVAACPEGSLDRLQGGTWSVHLSTLFGLRDLASHFQEGPEYSRVLKGRLSWPGARAGCPYPCGPSPLPGASLDSSVWFHHWCICLFCNHLPRCQPWGMGGNKGPDPFPLAEMTLKGLLRSLLWPHHSPPSPVPGPVSAPLLTAVIPEHSWANFLPTHLISEPAPWVLYCVGSI